MVDPVKDAVGVLNALSAASTHSFPREDFHEWQRRAYALPPVAERLPQYFSRPTAPASLTERDADVILQETARSLWRGEDLESISRWLAANRGAWTPEGFARLTDRLPARTLLSAAQRVFWRGIADAGDIALPTFEQYVDGEVPDGAFAALLQQVLERRFGGDRAQMARSFGIGEEALGSYLSGQALPERYPQLFPIVSWMKQHGIDGDRAEFVWFSDRHRQALRTHDIFGRTSIPSFHGDREEQWVIEFLRPSFTRLYGGDAGRMAAALGMDAATLQRFFGPKKRFEEARRFSYADLAAVARGIETKAVAIEAYGRESFRKRFGHELWQLRAFAENRDARRFEMMSFAAGLRDGQSGIPLLWGAYSEVAEGGDAVRVGLDPHLAMDVATAWCFRGTGVRPSDIGILQMWADIDAERGWKESAADRLLAAAAAHRILLAQSQGGAMQEDAFERMMRIALQVQLQGGDEASGHRERSLSGQLGAAHAMTEAQYTGALERTALAIGILEGALREAEGYLADPKIKAGKHRDAIAGTRAMIQSELAKLRKHMERHSGPSSPPTALGGLRVIDGGSDAMEGQGGAAGAVPAEAGAAVFLGVPSVGASLGVASPMMMVPTMIASPVAAVPAM